MVREECSFLRLWVFIKQRQVKVSFLPRLLKRLEFLSNLVLRNSFQGLYRCPVKTPILCKMEKNLTNR